MRTRWWFASLFVGTSVVLSGSAYVAPDLLSSPAPVAASAKEPAVSVPVSGQAPAAQPQWQTLPARMGGIAVEAKAAIVGCCAPEVSEVAPKAVQVTTSVTRTPSPCERHLRTVAVPKAESVFVDDKGAKAAAAANKRILAARKCLQGKR